MDTWLSFLGDLLWSGPWRNLLGRSRAHNRQSELRLRVALERELWGEDLDRPKPNGA
jgi:hypothetical protein